MLPVPPGPDEQDRPAAPVEPVEHSGSERQQLVAAGVEALQGVLQANSWRAVALRLGTIVLLAGAAYTGWVLWDLRPTIEARLREAPDVPGLDSAYAQHRDEVNGLLLQAVQAQGPKLLAVQLLSPYRGRSGMTLWEREQGKHRTPLEPGQPFTFGMGAAEQLGTSMLGLCGQRREAAQVHSVLCAVRGPVGHVRGWLRVELAIAEPLPMDQLLDWWNLAEGVSDTAWPRYERR